MTNDDKMLIDLVTTYTSATSSITHILEDIKTSMQGMTGYLTDINKFIQKVNNRDSSFKRYTLWGFVTVIVFQWVIIGALLVKLNKIGGSEILDVSTIAVKTLIN